MVTAAEGTAQHHNKLENLMRLQNFLGGKKYWASETRIILALNIILTEV